MQQSTRLRDIIAQLSQPVQRRRTADRFEELAEWVLGRTANNKRVRPEAGACENIRLSEHKEPKEKKQKIDDVEQQKPEKDQDNDF